MTNSSWKSAAALTLILAATLFGLAIRYVAMGEPIERDSGIYLQVAHGLLDGQVLYAQALDIKPPGVYLLFAGLMAAGMSAGWVLFLGSAVALLASILGLIVVLRHASVEWVPIGVTVAAFILLATDLKLESTQPNTEMFVNALALLGMAALLKAGRSLRRLLLAMLVLAAMSLFKHVGALIAVCFVCAHAFSPDRRGGFRWLRNLLLIGLVGVGMWLLLFAILYWQSAADTAWQTLILYPFDYAAIQQHGAGNASPLSRVLGSYSLTTLDPAFWPFLWVWLAAALFACIWCVRDGGGAASGTVVWVCIGWLAIVPLCIGLQGGGYPHYFQLCIPPLAVAFGLLLQRTAALGRGVPLVLACLILGLLGFRTSSWVTGSPDDWSIAKYGDQFVRARQAGTDAATLIRSDEGLFVWGVFPGIYAQAGHWPEAGIANVWLALPAYGGSLASGAGERLQQDLMASPPELIVLDPFTVERTPPDLAVGKWISSNYTVFARSSGFLFAARRGGALERRERERKAGR